MWQEVQMWQLQLQCWMMSAEVLMRSSVKTRLQSRSVTFTDWDAFSLNNKPGFYSWWHPEINPEHFPDTFMSAAAPTLWVRIAHVACCARGCCWKHRAAYKQWNCVAHVFIPHPQTEISNHVKILSHIKIIQILLHIKHYTLNITH